MNNVNSANVTFTADDIQRVNRVRIAQAFPGWTLLYIDSMSYADQCDVLAIMEADTLIAERERELAKQRG